MHFSSATASVAAGIVPVFLIALLVEQQRLLPSRAVIRGLRRDKFERWMWRAKQIVIGVTLISSAFIEIALLNVVESDGVDGAVGRWLWSAMVFWVIVPTTSIAFTMWDPPSRE